MVGVCVRWCSWHARSQPTLWWRPLRWDWWVTWRGEPLLRVVATAVAMAAFAGTRWHVTSGGGCPHTSTPLRSRSSLSPTTLRAWRRAARGDSAKAGQLSPGFDVVGGFHFSIYSVKVLYVSICRNHVACGSGVLSALSPILINLRSPDHTCKIIIIDPSPLEPGGHERAAHPPPLCALAGGMVEGEGGDVWREGVRRGVGLRVGAPVCCRRWARARHRSTERWWLGHALGGWGTRCARKGGGGTDRCGQPSNGGGCCSLRPARGDCCSLGRVRGMAEEIATDVSELRYG